MLSINSHSETTLLAINGPFDFNASRKIFEQINKISMSKNILIDFSACDQLDSSGLGCLFKLSAMIEDRNHALRVSGCNSEVRHLLEIMNFPLQSA